MPLVQPAIRIGDPVRHESVTVYPLFSDPGGGGGEVAYRLSSHALADESVVVEEVSEAGSVPDLMVENKSDLRILFLEGEQLVGAKQDRVLNTSVLVPARSRTKIPVSCVEQGRWGYRSKTFGSSGSYTPSHVRAALKSSVTKSLREVSRHTSDQMDVWSSVQHVHATSRTSSSTGAMEDAYVQHDKRLAAFREALDYVDGASGLAVGVGGRLLVLDLYDRPETCREVWPRLVSGAVFDAMALQTETAHGEPPEEALDRAEVEKVLAAARAAAWEEVEPVGDGQEYRADVESGHGSALTCEGRVVHESVVSGQQAGGSR